MGVVASLAMPRLIRKPVSVEWSSVKETLNNLLFFARQEAITTNVLHRLVFDARHNSIIVEAATTKYQQTIPVKDLAFQKAQSYYFTDHYQLPEQLHIMSVALGKKEVLNPKTEKAYCYILPNALIEGITLTLERAWNGKRDMARFVVEPFLGHFIERES